MRSRHARGARRRSAGRNDLATLRIGEHTREILSELRYGDDEVDRLVAGGAVLVDGEG
jgi:crotonobetainyl-CoA:carnitine CoA-transferase CaiB-like acyl-CoA transferase